MRLAEAERLIQEGERAAARTGFMVHFDKREGGMLISDFFPDKHQGEPLFEFESVAWDWAKNFAAYAPACYVNIYVIGSDFVPVIDYARRKLRQYPKEDA